jgi:ABC-2 type transport system permease protein
VTKAVPSIAFALATLIGVTWKRVLRSRSVWVVILIALLPSIPAAALAGDQDARDAVSVVEIIVMALLPSVFVASSIGEEIEDRTTTYLWSRPLPRWTVVVGKLLGLAPIAALLTSAGWVLAIKIGTGAAPTPQSTFAFAAGGLAISVIAASIAILVPKYGMALSIVYLVIIDLIVGEIPASLQTISITRQVKLLSGLREASAIATPALTMAIVAAVWLTIGLVRLRRLES